MHSTMTLSTFVAALFASTALAGSVSIQNQCGDTLNLWSIAGSADAEMKQLETGGTYTEEYRENSNGGGISIKLSLDKDHKDISQIEYTKTGDQIFYDLSNIDGYPLENGGVSIVPSDSSCPKIECEAGVSKCTDAYNKPDDDHATKGCPVSTDLHVTLCGGKKGAKLMNKSYIPRHPHARPEA